MNKLSDCITQYTSMPRAAYVLLAASLGTLGFVLIAQYVFKYDPCVLCLWQRLPYGLVAFFAVLMIFLKPSTHKILIGLIALCFVAGTGTAIFHTGVEQHWWLGTDGCAVKPLNAMTVEDLRTKLLGTPTAHCDEISWTFLGLSMANWNIPLSLALLVFSVLAFKKAR